MMKKLVALAATALFSLNASAGYARYDLEGPMLSGYFFQNEEDLSIAGYNFTVDNGRYAFNLFPSGNYGNLNWTRARYDNEGPSRFGVVSYLDEWINVNMWFNFSPTDNADVWRITSRFSAVQWYRESSWERFPNLVLYPTGTATRHEVDQEVADYFDYHLRETGEYPDGLRHIAPKLNVIPEPGSVALLALGAAGLAGASRRRKARSASC
ncbi:MAG TPA: hypothetical protein DDX04_19185 [Massilia sp.]|nr:hypothetical protein [Massilia sp.]